ncbi:hypothetical protein HDU98_000947 [Podochytrium sp. JEL0797]|nr:hypothetical protein HDU98_000947 [Podochytrium sp. JEL0797]
MTVRIPLPSPTLSSSSKVRKTKPTRAIFAHATDTLRLDVFAAYKKNPLALLGLEVPRSPVPPPPPPPLPLPQVATRAASRLRSEKGVVASATQTVHHVTAHSAASHAPVRVRNRRQEEADFA